MPVRKIVVASVLKPVIDTRLFEKLGLSLAQTNKYEVNIIGFWSKNIPEIPSVKFHPIFNFRRGSIRRLAASWKYYNILVKVKPDIIIVSTAELLPVSILYKIIFGSKLCYDVQENYYRNIKYTPTYPRPIRAGLAWIVRTIEDAMAKWIDQYLLAEKCYTYERSFPIEKSAIVLNKFRPLRPVKSSRPLSKLPKIRFLYTGTISLNYGILKAIEFAKNISILYPDISLEIIGFSPDSALIKKVKEEIAGFSFICLKTGNSPVPHQEIIESFSKTDFALLPYQPDKSIENCFPTKIWEYMAHSLPIIIQNHEFWVNYCEKYQSCLPIDYNNYNPHQIIKDILHKKYYPSGAPKDVFWHSEELTFIKAIERLL